MKDNKSIEIQKASKYTEEILDAICKKANIEKIVNEYSHLIVNQRNDLYQLLIKYKFLFYGALGE